MPKAEKAERVRGTRRLAAESNRTVASPEPHRFSDNEQPEFHEGQSVELLIREQTDIGYRVLVNDSDEGLLYKNEVFQPLRKGERIAGFVKKVREDGKIDLSLQKPGPEKVYEAAEKIMAELRAQGGFIALDDKTPPEDIYRLFGMSKKTYKKAIGALYRKRLILLEKAGVRMV